MVVTIRPARTEDAHGIAFVHTESWQTTYQGLMPAEYIAQRTLERRQRTWEHVLQQPDALVYVAEDKQGRLVGFANGGPLRSDDPGYAAEVYCLYLLQEAQRQGLGRTLVRVLVADFLAHGMESMLIWVLATNPARRFYEALGGILVREMMVEDNGFSLHEVAYGWPDLRAMSF
ncbi:L-amino acid N-acyltransferase YncA [Thermosporothrix hazakensis]|jgi:GNAT superfamily N-acetyltransferase|uniref:L-amino acid N-acyltransferase YncA n=2 Tax=Thermosporothrix TaxID=768650 RepID=A0A326UD17_THEHA|nr:GNAT family N-acetyltransferase [Thermosporothrix hazakensis]PZW36397.1 L-amino acid N-acyltransferase YncA [Thermosporothrix hazakensis]BBH88862.1 putative N-acetyltransferase YuaI [Thermosporothrix sp. COM3]GCE47047.1 putative N-acetyltransferase YuaI [Thermosporothrix hazakensis]